MWDMESTRWLEGHIQNDFSVSAMLVSFENVAPASLLQVEVCEGPS